MPLPDFLTIASSVCASGCLSAALIFLTKNWITERLSQSIQHEYAQKLEAHKATLKAAYDVAIEKLRADNAQARAVEQTATGAYLDSRRVGHQRTLDAIQATWESILKMDKDTPSVVGLLDILPEAEYPSMLANEKLAEMFGELSIKENAIKLVVGTQHIEHHRPYTGEYVWWLFHTYRALKGRVVHLIMESHRARTSKHWKDDDGIRQLLSAVLDEDEIKQVYETDPGGFGVAFSMIKQHFLVTTSQIISGESSATFGLELAQQIAATARNVEKELPTGTGP